MHESSRGKTRIDLIFNYNDGIISDNKCLSTYQNVVPHIEYTRILNVSNKNLSVVYNNQIVTAYYCLVVRCNFYCSLIDSSAMERD